MFDGPSSSASQRRNSFLKKPCFITARSGIGAGARDFIVRVIFSWPGFDVVVVGATAPVIAFSSGFGAAFFAGAFFFTGAFFAGAFFAGAFFFSVMEVTVFLLYFWFSLPRLLRLYRMLCRQGLSNA